MVAPPQTVATERNPPRRTPQISESIMVQVGSISGSKLPDSPPILHRPTEPPTTDLYLYALHMFATSHSSTGPVNERLLLATPPSASGTCTIEREAQAQAAAQRRAEDAVREFDAVFRT